MKIIVQMNRFKQIFEELRQLKEGFKTSEPISLTSEQLEASNKQTEERFTKISTLSTDLAQRGWYLHDKMPLKYINMLRPLLRTNKYAEVDAHMITYLCHAFREIEQEIISAFPERAEILSAAFLGHHRKDYALCIPVFLAQADGICSELLGVGVYSRAKGIPKTASAVERFKDKFTSAFLEPLRVSGALNANEKEKHQYPDILNRHEVLHGKSLDYATSINSFRAISLLCYLCSTVFSERAFEEFKKQEGQI